MHYDYDNDKKQDTKSVLKWYGIQICKTGNPPTFCSNWPIESCQDQANKQAH
jgi:hypothetical protein